MEPPHEPSWPVSIGTTRGAAGATLTWRRHGQLHVTIVLKATFAIAAGGALRPTDPEPIAPDEQEDAAGLRTAGDLVPFRPKADILVTGHARPTARAAYLGLARGAEVLLDKAVDLLAPAPAAGKIPVRGLGPLSRTWPIRRQLLGDLDPRLFDLPEPILPASLDPAFFQSAPADQRVDPLRGGERLILEIEGGGDPPIDLHLPAARGTAWLYGRSPALAAGHALALALDTAHLDLDRRTLTLVWRGFLPIPPDEAPASLRVIGRVELTVNAPAPPPPVKAVEETIRLDADTPAPLPPPRPKPPLRSVEETIRLDAGSAAELLASAAMPFTAPRAEAPFIPAPSPPPGPKSPLRSVEETIRLDAGSAAELLASAAMPFTAPSLKAPPIFVDLTTPPEEGAGPDPRSFGDHFLLAMGLSLEESPLEQGGSATLG